MLAGGVAVLALSLPGHDAGASQAPAPSERLVVVTVRPVAAGAVLQRVDLAEQRRDGDGASVHLGDVTGRAVLVALPAGAVVEPYLTAAARGAQRLVEIALDAHIVDGALQAGDAVDVLAAATPGGVDRVEAVAQCMVVSVRDDGTAAAVLLSCDPSAAARVIWAENFAKQVRVLDRPAGPVSALPATTGLEP